MFFPIGFGQRPKIIPFGILVIALVAIIWSFWQFPTMRSFEAAAKRGSHLEVKEFREKIKRIIAQSCLEKFPGNSQCELERKPAGLEKSSTPSETLKQTYEMADFYSKFEKAPENWPSEAKAVPEYQDLMSDLDRRKKAAFEAAVAAGLPMRSNAGLISMLRASFTHSGYMHLAGNLFFLIIFGLWVEQREGAVFTLATFLAGSALGLGAQMSIAPTVVVLGASAGIMALMGAFLIFFRSSDFDFIFAIPPFYFRKISMPLLWVIPIFYVATDLSGITSAASGVSHWAHLVGFAVGCSMALIYQYVAPLPTGVLFPQELPLLHRLQVATDPAEVCSSFYRLLDFNPLSRTGLALAAGRISDLKVDLRQSGQSPQFERAIQPLITDTLKNKSLEEILGFLTILPTELDLKAQLAKSPLSQLLHVADLAAQRENYRVALPLYEVALGQAPERQRPIITQAIQTILEKSQNLDQKGA